MTASPTWKVNGMSAFSVCAEAPPAASTTTAAANIDCFVKPFIVHPPCSSCAAMKGKAAANSQLVDKSRSCDPLTAEFEPCCSGSRTRQFTAVPVTLNHQGCLLNSSSSPG